MEPMQDFLKKFAYLIAFLPIFYAACAMVQFTVLRPKTRYVVISVFAMGGALIGLLGLLSLAAPNVQDPRTGKLMLVLAAVTFLPLFKSVRLLLGRLTPLDPNSTVDISGTIVLLWFIVLTGFAIFTTSIADLAGQAQITVSDQIINVLAYPVIAFSLVGIFVTRDWRESIKRLGLERPTPRQVGIAVALVVPLLAISIGADAIGRAVSPGVYEQLQQVLNAMSSHVTNPFIAIIIGLTAGIGEEILFRGAIQPRFGIAVTALAFAVAHTQYGFSFAIAGVFVTGIVLGYERKTMNTTACIITHATYDILALLLAYFAGAGLGG